MIRFNENFDRSDEEPEIPNGEIDPRFQVEGVPDDLRGFERAPALDDVSVWPEFDEEQEVSDDSGREMRDRIDQEELVAVRNSLEAKPESGDAWSMEQDEHEDNARTVEHSGARQATMPKSPGREMYYQSGTFSFPDKPGIGDGLRKMFKFLWRLSKRTFSVMKKFFDGLFSK